MDYNLFSLHISYSHIVSLSTTQFLSTLSFSIHIGHYQYRKINDATNYDVGSISSLEHQLGNYPVRINNVALLTLMLKLTPQSKSCKFL